jgi:hypothetical protein
MAKLHHFYYGSLQNGEHKSMTEETLDVIRKYVAIALKVEILLAAVDSALAVETAALGRIAKNPYTEQLLAADTLRDETLKGLVAVIRGNEHNPNPVVAAAAHELLSIPQLNSNIVYKSYEEEESLLDLLLRHLEGDFAPQVTVLGLGAWVTQLSAQNVEVRRLHELSYASSAAKAGISVKEARKATDRALEALYTRLNALIETDTETDYAAFITEYNVLVKYYETLVKERKTKNRHKQKNLEDSDISSISDQPYSGDLLSPHVEVLYHGVPLTVDVDFTVEYTNNIDPGTARVTIRGKGQYTGKQVTTFNIIRPL